MRRRLMLAVLAALVLQGLLVGPASAKPDPPGNNGTWKVDGLPFDGAWGVPDHPNNEPHVGCWFQLDFYGYDEGALNATATLELHPPTLPPGASVPWTRTAFIGEDAAGGGTDLDGSIWYTTEGNNQWDDSDGVRNWLVNENGMTLADMHPIQGFHVKLTVHAEGSQGADTKHKVFWIRCHDGVFPPGEGEDGGEGGE